LGSETETLRVAHLSSFHPPLDVRIFQKECRTLARAGYDVHLIIRDPKTDRRDGVRFHALVRADEKGRVARVWNRLSSAYRIARSLESRVYHFHESELIPVGLLLRLGGAEVVYDVHEDAPREAISLNRGHPLKGRLRALAISALEAVARVALSGFVCATPAIARRFPGGKAVLVQNFPVMGEYDFSDAAPPLSRRPLRVIYVGGISEIRGVREMVRAMALLPEPLSEARLVIAGEFKDPALEAEVRALPGWERVDYLGWQTREQVAGLLAGSRVGLVLYYPLRDHLEAQPNKLFEYMAAGIPSVSSDFPYWREIVDPVRCGVPADPRDPRSIAGAIARLLEDPGEAEAMGRRGREAVRERFNWESESRKLVAFYEKLTSRKSL
jgi:glycosyltransferase involved in cell wall biosynthesis